MKVLILGATGMIGQGVLRECLSAPDVDSVLVAGRTPLGQTHTKLTEVLRPDLLQWTDVEPRLAGIDACFYCPARPSHAPGHAQGFREGDPQSADINVAAR